MEHGLEYIAFYVQKYIALVAIRSNPQVDRDKPLGAPAFMRLAYQSSDPEGVLTIWRLPCSSVSTPIFEIMSSFDLP